MRAPQAFVWSDQHFFHLNIIKYTKRPFAFSQDGILEQNKVMLSNYQKLVEPQDLVVFLGDVAFARSENREPLQQLFQAMPGSKLLLKGNHDSAAESFYKSLGFIAVFPHLVCGDYFLCHYPLGPEVCSKHEAEAKAVFKNSGCSKIIHGHTHNTPCQYDDGLWRWNVCVDYGQNNFSPLLIHDEVLTKDLLKLAADLALGQEMLFPLPL